MRKTRQQWASGCRSSGFFLPSLFLVRKKYFFWVVPCQICNFSLDRLKNVFFALILLGNNGQQWTTMSNNGKQWATLGNIEQQWATMDKMDKHGKFLWGKISSKSYIIINQSRKSNKFHIYLTAISQLLPS